MEALRIRLRSPERAAPHGAPDHDSVFSWRVEGNLLVIGSVPRGEQSKAGRSTTDVYTKVTGVLSTHELEHLPFVLFSKDELQLGGPREATLKLTRMTE